jgi:hypothetical protein
MSEPTNLKIGDLVVGTNDPSKSVYDSMGKRIRAGGGLAGSEEQIAEMQKDIMKSAMNMGGRVMKQAEVKPTKGKGRKKKAEEPQFTTPNYPVAQPIQPTFMPIEIEYEPEQIKLETIIFENDFGKIRAKVENILEHEQALLLLFSSDDEVAFEPKVGETLKLYRGRVGQDVYYPGVIFDWTDGVKRAMILFKANAQNE